NTTANAAVIQQLIAGMRWIWLNYGTPTAAWGHIQRTGRFTSYPRTGTEDDATRDPLRRCPVGGGVHYSDDFGERRTVGGYHPHWGNDVIAPTGRPVRAPFDGFAVGHRRLVRRSMGDGRGSERIRAERPPQPVRQAR